MGEGCDRGRWPVRRSAIRRWRRHRIDGPRHRTEPAARPRATRGTGGVAGPGSAGSATLRLGRVNGRCPTRPGGSTASLARGRRARGDLALIGAVPALPGRAGRRVRGRSTRQGRTGRDATTPCRSARRLSSGGTILRGRAIGRRKAAAVGRRSHRQGRASRPPGAVAVKAGDPHRADPDAPQVGLPADRKPGGGGGSGRRFPAFRHVRIFLRFGHESQPITVVNAFSRSAGKLSSDVGTTS